MILFYVRHGDPIYDPDSLTPLGKRQAEAAAKRLATFGVDRIFSSTSIRAEQTAKPLCELLGQPCAKLDFMHESLMDREMGVQVTDTRRTWFWSHPTYAQLLCSREVRSLGERWYEHSALASLPLEQSIRRVGAAADEWLASLGYEHDREKGLYRIKEQADPHQRVALFAHEGVGKVFMSEVLDIPFPLYAEHFDMKHSGITVICFDHGTRYRVEGYARARVLTLSNDAHLLREGLPLTHISSGLEERY